MIKEAKLESKSPKAFKVKSKSGKSQFGLRVITIFTSLNLTELFTSSLMCSGDYDCGLSKITSDKNADDFESKTKDYGCLKMRRREVTGDATLSYSR